MIWEVCWSDLAKARLRELHWREATQIDAAVMRYAETGEGDVVRIARDDSVTVRLRVGGTSARMVLDPFDGVMYVWTVYRLER